MCRAPEAQNRQFRSLRYERGLARGGHVVRHGHWSDKSQGSATTLRDNPGNLPVETDQGNIEVDGGGGVTIGIPAAPN
jgi:hypothetical protein